MLVVPRIIIGVVALALFALPGGAQELSPDVLRLAHAMTTNRDLLKRLPLYTCLETIERSRPHKHGRSSDRDVVQVDVGVGETGEMYSWPDETSFSSLDLPDLVGHGMLSTGMFSGFAHSLFVGDHGVVQGLGNDVIQGRDALRFTYRVPSLANQWKINWEGNLGELQETGKFWVDAQDYHLMRMQVDAQEIPPQMLLRSVTLVMDYDVVPSDFGKTLLPVESRMAAIDSGGRLYYNSAAFSHCHVFAAESKMSASDVDAAAVFTRYKQNMESLPAGLILRIVLTEPILAKNARVGDSISARLESAVRFSPELQIPAGVLLKGRIREFARLDDPPNTYQVGIAFSELEWAERSYRFFAELFGMDPLRGVESEIFRSSAVTMPLGTTAMGKMTKITGESMFGYPIPGAATFFLRDTPALPRGFRMTWRTMKMSR
jgi:hypothetical protein